MAATSHFTKAGSRLMINTSPEPVTNWTASIMEDVAVVAGLWAALNYPLLFIGLLVPSLRTRPALLAAVTVFFALTALL